MTSLAVARPDVPRGTLRYRPELDGIRGAAILLVLAGHTGLLGFDKAGRVGVTLFFVLSGYLITGILLRERAHRGRIDLRSFYTRRARRLLPALIAVVVVTGGVMAASGRFSEFPGQALVSVFYVGNIAYANGMDMGYLAHTWSLSLEEQFYLLWPALLILAPRCLVPIAVVGIAASMVLRLVVTPSPTVAFGPLVRVDAILWGCLLALVPLRVPGSLRFVGWAAIALLVLADPDPMRVGLSVAALASALVVATTRPGVLSWRPLVRVGELSYGLYLWHFLPATMFPAGSPLVIPVVWAASFGLALVSERWIERPWRRRRQPMSASPTERGALPLPMRG